MSLASPTKLDVADDESPSPTASVTHEEYSARMEEIMDDSDDDGGGGSEDGFIYDGVDAPQLGYREQLREALSDEEGDEDEVLQDVQDEKQVEQIVGNANGNGNGVPPAVVVDDELASNDVRCACAWSFVLTSSRARRARNAHSPHAYSCRPGRSSTIHTSAQSPQRAGPRSSTRLYRVYAPSHLSTVLWRQSRRSRRRSRTT